MADFFLYACGNGVDLPHVAKRAFGDQMGLTGKKEMPFGNPPQYGTNKCGLSPKNIISFLEAAGRGAFHGLRAGGSSAASAGVGK